MSFFRKRRLFILLIGIIIFVLLIGYSLRDRGGLTTAEQLVNDTVGWAQSAVHTQVKLVTDIIKNKRNLKKTYTENILLTEKLSQYKSLIYEVQYLKEDNEELKKTIDKPESIRDFNAIQATLISRSPERWIEQVTITKGE